MCNQLPNSLSRLLFGLAVLVVCGGYVDTQRTVEYQPQPNALTLDKAVRQSDLIVRGIIASAQFAVDHEIVWTEYSVNTTRTLFQRLGTAPDGRVGAVNAIVFRIGGGTGTVNGELITARDINYHTDSFRIGSEYILLLKYIPDLQRYYPTSGSYSVFRVEGGLIEPLNKVPWEDRPIKGMPTERFVQTIQQLLPPG